MGKKIPEWFLKELYAKEEKYFQLYNDFTPNYKNPLLARKFYSPYEDVDLASARPELVEKVQVMRDMGPREKYRWPATESQSYGWFYDKAFPRDPLFSYPNRTAPFIKHELRLLREKSVRPKFTGLPFRTL